MAWATREVEGLPSGFYVCQNEGWTLLCFLGRNVVLRLVDSVATDARLRSDAEGLLHGWSAERQRAGEI